MKVEPREETSPGRTLARRRIVIVAVVGLLIVAAALVVTFVLDQRVSPQVELARAVTAFENNDLATVRLVLERFRASDDLQPHAELLAGMLLLRKGELFDAIGTFGHANEHPDTKALAYAFSGEALYKAGIFRDADRILTIAAKLDPDNINNHRWLAATYYDIGAMHNALSELAIVAKLDPTDPRPNRLRGLIFRDYEKYDEAVGEYRQSLERSREQPDLEWIQFELAECLVKLRRHKEAKSVLAECRESPDIWALQAECCFAHGQIIEAKKLANRTLTAAPEHVGAASLAATIAIEEQDLKRAAEILETAAKAHPKEYLVQFKLAELYRLMGDQDKAKKQAEVAENLRQLRARFTKLHDQALVDASDAEIRYQLGLAAVELEKWELAISWFRAALALDPQHRDAAQSLRMLTSPADSQR